MYYIPCLSFVRLHLFRFLVNCELWRKCSLLLFIHSSEEQTNGTLLQYVVVILGYCCIIHICGSIYDKHSKLFQIFSTSFCLPCYKIRSNLLICTQYFLLICESRVMLWPFTEFSEITRNILWKLCSFLK